MVVLCIKSPGDLLKCRFWFRKWDRFWECIYIKPPPAAGVGAGDADDAGSLVPLGVASIYGIKV